VYSSRRILNYAIVVVLGRKNKCKPSWVRLMHNKIMKAIQLHPKKKLMLLLLRQEKAQGCCSSWRNVGNGERMDLLNWMNYNWIKFAYPTCIHIWSNSMVMLSPLHCLKNVHDVFINCLDNNQIPSTKGLGQMCITESPKQLLSNYSSYF
jgi:hypothetical protein